MERTARLFVIQRRLQAARNAVSFEQLQEELKVSRATLNRDIRYLRDRLLAPILYIKERRGYCLDRTTAERHELPGLWFSGQEAAALLSFYGFLERLQPGLLHDCLAPLQARLLALVEENSRHTLAEMQARIRVLPLASRTHQPQAFAVIGQATLARKRLSLTYYNRERDEETTREISPQRLVHYRDNWYLDAWDHGKKVLRTFALDCVRAAAARDARARDIAEKTLDTELGSGYGIFAGRKTQWAKLRFASARARWVANEQWHPKQKGHYESDGHYVLAVPYTDDRELVMDILKYGADVEVLAPPALRKRVAECLERALAQYGGNDRRATVAAKD